MPRFKILSAIVLFALMSVPASLLRASNEESLSPNSAVIYFNEQCGDCGVYVKNQLPLILKKHGYADIRLRDYINDTSNRPKLNKTTDELGIPIELQSHIMAFVGDKVILGGHVPDSIINYLLNAENQKEFEKIIVYQDEMHKAPYQRI
jgi:hypothetical protein